MDSASGALDPPAREAARYLLQDRSAGEFLAGIRDDLIAETLPRNALIALIKLFVITIHNDTIKSERTLATTQRNDTDPTPIRRAGNW